MTAAGASGPAGILSGVRVVDFGHHIAGPLAAVMLADQGADVIRVDRPGTADTARDAYLHRRKRRLTLDLKDPGDLDRARAIVAQSDVLIENFRPGVMARLGLGVTELRAADPRLVYLSMPGFASDDPRAGVPAWEGVIAAATGNCRLRIGEADEGWDYTRPTYSAIPMASNFAAILGAYGVVSALTARERTGRGAHIELPLFNAVFELIGGAGAYPVERGFAVERPLDRMGSGTYECGDGRHVQFNPIGASSRFLGWLLDAAGEHGWAAEGLTSRAYVESTPGAADELRRRLRALFRRRTAQEWEDAANAAGVPLCMVRSAEEWLRHPHAVQSEQVASLRDPVLGHIRMAGRSVRTSARALSLTEPRHERDADRAAILDEASHEPEARAVADPAGDTLPHTGLRVVDLTQILAGPTAGRMLAEFGADVVKINAPQRPIEAHGIVNRGKRSMLLDLETTAGQDVLWKLVDRADVLTLNFPRATAERYGLGYEHVRARRPAITYVAVSCYGYDGPWESRRGYEVQGQAASGVMRLVGGAERPGVLGPYNLLDYGTGAMAAYAAALGVFHQTRTGESLLVSTSLAQTGVFHLATMSVASEDGTPQVADPAGRHVLGRSAAHRFYQAADGWFFLGGGDGDLAQIATAAGVAEPAGADEERGEELAAGLARAFAHEPVAHWEGKLSSRTVGVHRVVPLKQLMGDDWVRAHGLSIRQRSAEVGDVVMPGTPFVWDGRPVPAGHAAPPPGADGRAIMSSVGLAERADALQQSWVLQLDHLPGGWDIP